MNIDSYINAALRTEKRMEALNTDPQLLEGILELTRAFGHLVDVYKKQAIYGKEGLEGELINAVAVVIERAYVVEDRAFDPIPELVNDYNPRLVHGVLGVAGEVGEISSALVSASYGERQVDPVNLVEEVGDTMWYQALLFDAVRDLCDRSPSDVMEINIRKLRERFPQAFDLERSNERNVEAERAVLEGRQ